MLLRCRAKVFPPPLRCARLPILTGTPTSDVTPRPPPAQASFVIKIATDGVGKISAPAQGWARNSQRFDGFALGASGASFDLQSIGIKHSILQKNAAATQEQKRTQGNFAKRLKRRRSFRSYFRGQCQQHTASKKSVKSQPV